MAFSNRHGVPDPSVFEWYTKSNLTKSNLTKSNPQVEVPRPIQRRTSKEQSSDSHARFIAPIASVAKVSTPMASADKVSASHDPRCQIPSQGVIGQGVKPVQIMFSILCIDVAAPKPVSLQAVCGGVERRNEVC